MWVGAAGGGVSKKSVIAHLFRAVGQGVAYQLMGQADRNPQLCADLLERQPLQAMQDKRLAGTFRKPGQSMLQFAQLVQMQGLLLGRWGAGNVLVGCVIAGGVAVLKADAAIEVKRQVAHDSVEVANGLGQGAEVVRPLAESQPGVLHNIFCLGAAAHDGGGIVHQSMSMREVQLKPFVGVGHGFPGVRMSDLKMAGY